MGTVTSAYQDGVKTLTLSRIEKKNALTIEMYQQLSKHLMEAAEDPQVAVIVLTGDGHNFTAGNDLNEFLTADLSEGSIIEFLTVLSTFPKPIITAAQGAAVGIGTTIMLHSDLIVCANNTHMQLPFVRLGLVPEAASSLLLPQHVGYAKAAEWLLLGEPFSAKQALQAGLINCVVDDSALMQTAMKAANAIAALPAGAVQATKKLLHQHQQGAVAKAISSEATIFAERLKSDDCKQAIQQFFSR